MGWILILSGLLVALAASALLVSGLIETGQALAMGVMDIGLIAVSGRWIRPKPSEKPVEERIEQTVYSPDHQLRALVKKHADGKYRIEMQRFYREEWIDFGPQERWVRQSHAIVTDTLASAIEIAARHVNAGGEDFYER